MLDVFLPINQSKMVNVHGLAVTVIYNEIAQQQKRCAAADSASCG